MFDVRAQGAAYLEVERCALNVERSPGEARHPAVPMRAKRRSSSSSGNSSDAPLPDRILRRIKNNKLIAVVIVVATVLISLSTFVDSVEKLRSILGLGKKEELTGDSGLVAKPTTPAQFYHNARVYELGGDVKNALAAYEQYFASDQEFIDPHYFFQDMLKNAEGLQGARSYYAELQRRFPGRILYEFMAARLADSNERIAAYEKVLAHQNDYPPAVLELTREYARLDLADEDTLETQQREWNWLETFLRLDRQSSFLRFYLDKRLGLQAVEEVKARHALVATWNLPSLTRPITVNAEVDRDGLVTIGFSPSEITSEILYKLPGASEFVSTGASEIVNKDGMTFANYSASVGRLAPGKHPIQVKYRDRKGRVQGPFDLEVNVPVEAVQNAERYLANWWQNPRAKWLMYELREGRLSVTPAWLQIEDEVERFSRVTYKLGDATEQEWIRDGKRLTENGSDISSTGLLFPNFRATKCELVFDLTFVTGKRYRLSYAFDVVNDDKIHDVEEVQVAEK